MKRWMIFLVFSVLVAPALADTYQVTFGWTDTTVYRPEETKGYEAKYRIAGGAETTIPNLTVPGGSITMIANPGQSIEMANQNCSMIPTPLCSPWSGWVTATAPFGQTTPNVSTDMTITIIRTGP
jgi:hypothetical protein